MSETEIEGDVQEATVRRAPKYGAFIVVGGLVGFLATAIATMQFPADPNVGLIASVAYFSLFGISGGVVLGGLLALVLDRRSLRRRSGVELEHVAVEPEPVAEPETEAPAPEDATAPDAADGERSTP